MSADTRTRQQIQYRTQNTEYFTIPDPSQVSHTIHVIFNVSYSVDIPSLNLMLFLLFQGEVILLRELDREEKYEHIFTVQALVPTKNLTSYALVSSRFSNSAKKENIPQLQDHISYIPYSTLVKLLSHGETNNNMMYIYEEHHSIELSLL